MKLYVNQPIWLDISLDGVHVRRGTDGLFLNVPLGKDVVWLNDADLTWTTERVSLADPGLGMATLMNDFNMESPMDAALAVLPPRQQPRQQARQQTQPIDAIPQAPPPLTDKKPVIPRKSSPIVNSREKNAFMLYCKENEESVKKEIPLPRLPGSVVAELDRRWKLLSEDEKKQWKKL